MTAATTTSTVVVPTYRGPSYRGFRTRRGKNPSAQALLRILLSRDLPPIARFPIYRSYWRLSLHHGTVYRDHNCICDRRGGERPRALGTPPMLDDVRAPPSKATTGNRSLTRQPVALRRSVPARPCLANRHKNGRGEPVKRGLMRRRRTRHEADVDGSKRLPSNPESVAGLSRTIASLDGREIGRRYSI